MAERTFIPNSTACVQWEILLADALDGLLRPEDQALFSAHKSLCPACAALFEEARRGREWLEFLSPSRRFPRGCWTESSPKPVRGKWKAPAWLPAVTYCKCLRHIFRRGSVPA